MKIGIWLGMLCSALLVGCGNRVKPADVESAEVKSAKVESAKVKSKIYRWLSGRSYCSECSADKEDIVERDIDRIELEKTGFDGILRAKVYVKCPEHGNILSLVSEWDVSGPWVERVK
ncbi:MAG: hypothetical protein ACI4QD_04735 [Kiritimatiellia bacterium]